jgi:tetratricopeptide (TPR) repeat protein
LPELTRRERDTLLALCRPLLAADTFTEPASVREIAAELVVTEAAVKQHLSNLYFKFGIAKEPRRRLLLANAAIRIGALSAGDLEGSRPLSPVGDDVLAGGRAAVDRHDWTLGHELLKAAAQRQTLGGDDVERLAQAALWVGEDDESMVAHQHAYQAYVAEGRPDRAAHVAAMLVIHHARRGELAVASGWYAKLQTLLQEAHDARGDGYLALATTIFDEASGDWEAALDHAGETLRIGRACADPDLTALALAFEGLALTQNGHVSEGARRFDEAMASAAAGELTMMATGIVYCRTLCASLALHDFRRANEWAEAIERCRATNGMCGFPGDCRTHRAEALFMHGAWTEGQTEAQLATTESELWHRPHAGIALYELGEINLRLGNHELAEHAFLEAHAHGYPPQPGLALLRLAQGNHDAADEAITGALSNPTLDPLARARLLPARTEIALARGNVAAAHKAADELVAIGERFGTPALRAAGLAARGATALADGHTDAAAPDLARAITLWREAEIPYETARTETLLGEARLARGERNAALLELRAAAITFERLGARPDANAVNERIAALTVSNN